MALKAWRYIGAQGGAGALVQGKIIGDWRSYALFEGFRVAAMANE
jgi:hypothetical protein